MSNLIKLEEVFKITSGGTPSRKNSSYFEHGDIPWVKTGDLKTKYIEDTPEKITALGLEQSSAKMFPPRTVLIAMYGATIGNCSILKIPACSNQACGAFLPSENIAEEYLYYYLRSIKQFFVNRGQGGGQPNISGKLLKNTKIPLIPIEQQLRIATLLSWAEELITKRKKSIRLLDKLLKSTFLEMFDSGAKGFNDWPVRAIQTLAAKKKRSMRTGPFGSNLLHKEFTTEGDVAVLGIDNAVNNRFEWNQKRFISQKKYDSLKNYTIHPRDVIITIMGTTGRSAVVPDNIPLAINTKHLAAITLDESEANPYFLSFSIYSNPYVLRQLRSQNRGAIMKGLNLGIIKRLKIKLPPIELQNHFEHVLKKVESLKTKYETSLQELENLYGSLSQRAFRGELDVSKVPIHHELVVDDVVQVQEVDTPTIVIEKGDKFELNIKSIQKLISGTFTKPFSFAMLWEQINTMLLDQEADEEKETPAEGEELHTYETVQQLIYTMLNGSNPFLKQIFSQDGQQKEIVLELAR